VFYKYAYLLNPETATHLDNKSYEQLRVRHLTT